MTDQTRHDLSAEAAFETLAETDDLRTMLLRTNRNFLRAHNKERRQKRINLAITCTFAVDLLITVVSVNATITAHNALDATKAQVVAECERGNVAGQTEIDLWTSTLVGADPTRWPNETHPAPATPQELAEWEDQAPFREQFFDNLNEGFGPKEC